MEFDFAMLVTIPFFVATRSRKLRFRFASNMTINPPHITFANLVLSFT
jgi:hypothetical protein